MGELFTGIENYKIEKDILESLKKQEDKKSKLYQCVFYLAPGDYHRYHSPISFKAKKRNYIVGKLAPVKVSYIEKHDVSFIPHLIFLKLKNLRIPSLK